MTTGSTTVTLRAKTSVVAFVALVLLCVVLLADALVRGRPDVALAALPTTLLLSWLGFVVFALPCVRMSDRGLRIVNVLRTTDATWPAITDVAVRFQTVVTLASGRRVRAWGGPTAARQAGTATSAPEHKVPAAQQLEEAWATHRSRAVGESTVTRSWHWFSILTGGALVVIVAIQLLALL